MGQITSPVEDAVDVCREILFLIKANANCSCINEKLNCLNKHTEDMLTDVIRYGSSKLTF